MRRSYPTGHPPEVRDDFVPHSEADPPDRRRSLRWFPMTDEHGNGDTERQEFIGALAKHRGLLVRTLRGISDEQARLRPTVTRSASED